MRCAGGSLILPGRTGRSPSNAKAAFGRRGGIRGHWALRRTAASTTPRQCRAGGCCALRQAWSKAARGASNALFLVEKQEVGNVGKRWASFLRHERSVARRGNGGFARACLPIYLVPFRYRNVFAD